MEWIKNCIYRLTLKYIRYTLTRNTTQLTPEHLLAKGWNKFGRDYYEPLIKDRNRVTIIFDHHYYRVRHSKNGTFIALESSKEWLEMYLLLMDKHNKPRI